MEVVKRTIKNINGVIAEEVIVNDPQIRKITYFYEGTEDDLDNFLKRLIIDKVRKDKLIDW